MGLTPKDGSISKKIYEYGEKEGEIKGLLRGIELYITVKFGSEGINLLKKIEKIEEIQMVEHVMESIIQADFLEKVKKILTMK
jgi:hypothetical protein